MFEKRKNEELSVPDKHRRAPPEPAAAKPNSYQELSTAKTVAVIGPTIKIKGDVTGDESLIIEGKVEGTVDLHNSDLTVGRSGEVHANVTANCVRIDGEVKGDVSGIEKVIISKTGRVQGNIVGPRVTLEDGAKFKGSIDMDPTTAVKLVAKEPKAAGKAHTPSSTA
jgi:cytoskeletal protein CcmA (bactofilin family)